MIDRKNLIDCILSTCSMSEGVMADAILELVSKENDQLCAELEASRAGGEVEAVIFGDYDCGSINDFGGGNVNWWQDYLRAEIDRANDFWRYQVEQNPLYTAPPVVVMKNRDNDSERNKRINTLSNNLWVIYTDSDNDAQLKNHRVWDALVEFEASTLKSAPPVVKQTKSKIPESVSSVRNAVTGDVVSVAPVVVPDEWVGKLSNIRDCIASSPIDCLGTGYPTTPDDCPPWPIRDEIVNDITKMLKAAPQPTNGEVKHCWEGGTKEECDCPDCGRSLIQIAGVNYFD